MQVLWNRLVISFHTDNKRFEVFDNSFKANNWVAFQQEKAQHKLILHYRQYTGFPLAQPFHSSLIQPSSSLLVVEYCKKHVHSCKRIHPIYPTHQMIPKYQPNKEGQTVWQRHQQQQSLFLWLFLDVVQSLSYRNLVRPQLPGWAYPRKNRGWPCLITSCSAWRSRGNLATGLQKLWQHPAQSSTTSFKWWTVIVHPTVSPKDLT